MPQDNILHWCATTFILPLHDLHWWFCTVILHSDWLRALASFSNSGGNHTILQCFTVSEWNLTLTTNVTGCDLALSQGGELHDPDPVPTITMTGQHSEKPFITNITNIQQIWQRFDKDLTKSWQRFDKYFKFDNDLTTIWQRFDNDLTIWQRFDKDLFVKIGIVSALSKPCQSVVTNS